jgi:hypothetical protein
MFPDITADHIDPKGIHIEAGYDRKGFSTRFHEDMPAFLRDLFQSLQAIAHESRTDNKEALHAFLW